MHPIASFNIDHFSLPRNGEQLRTTGAVGLGGRPLHARGGTQRCVVHSGCSVACKIEILQVSDMGAPFRLLSTECCVARATDVLQSGGG
jgi:hypothetical protein